MIDIKHFKNLLETELKTLESELETVGRKNPTNKEDWEAVEPDTNEGAAEEGDLAEGMEEYENNSAILNQLETRLNEVKSALEKIKDGRYGICDISDHQIEIDRLEANPAARTCKLHMKD
jgi:RNA polymerase-binding transcription factor DksA